MKLKNIFKSIRAKLFLTLCIVIVMIIAFFVIISNAVLETLYYTSKKILWQLFFWRLAHF